MSDAGGMALPSPLSIAVDRAMAVPQGWTVATGYVDVFKVRLACRARMAVGDVDRAYQKRLQAGGAQPFPCPNGEWIDEGTFELHDGRHEWVAAVMLGQSHLLVAWLVPPSA